MNTTILEDIGMTQAEIKIYLALLQLGSSTAGPIIEKTNLQNSVVHLTLRKLLAKGFVTYIKKGKIRHYSAANPETLLEFHDEQRAKLQNLVPALKEIAATTEKQEAEIYQGFKGFKSMLYEFIKDTKPCDEYLYFAFYTENPDNFEYVYNFYKDFEKERKKRGLLVKGLAPKRIKNKFKNRDRSGIRFVDLPIPTNISICRNKVLFTPWEDGQISFVITSKQLANSLKDYFYSVWNSKIHKT